MLKMYTKDGKWIVDDNGRNIEFDASYDAWMYVFLMRGIRPGVAKTMRSQAVTSLNPIMKKTVNLIKE